jgi:hypothetical protein
MLIFNDFREFLAQNGADQFGSILYHSKRMFSAFKKGLGSQIDLSGSWGIKQIKRDISMNSIPIDLIFRCSVRVVKHNYSSIVLGGGTKVGYAHIMAKVRARCVQKPLRYEVLESRSNA